MCLTSERKEGSAIWTRTLAGQCAAVAVGGTDDSGERLYSRQARKKDSGFGTGKMSSALSGDFYQPEPFVRTMAQAQYLSKARMEWRQRQSGGPDWAERGAARAAARTVREGDGSDKAAEWDLLCPYRPAHFG